MKTIVQIYVFVAALIFSPAARADPGAEFLVGEIAYNIGDWWTARAVFEGLVERVRAPELLHNLVLVHLKLDNIYTARGYLARYIRSFPSRREAYAHAEVRVLERRVVGAIEAYEHLIYLERTR